MDGGGTALDTLVWSVGALPKGRRLLHFVRDRDFLLGPPGIWDGEWVSLASALVTAEDVGAWPIPRGFWLSGLLFLETLHWPAAGADFGVGGVSFVEVLIFFELWAGERLVFRKGRSSIGGLNAQFQCRLFRLVQALIFGARVCSLGHFSGSACYAWWHWQVHPLQCR